MHLNNFGHLFFEVFKHLPVHIADVVPRVTGIIGQKKNMKMMRRLLEEVSVRDGGHFRGKKSVQFPVLTPSILLFIVSVARLCAAIFKRH